MGEGDARMSTPPQTNVWFTIVNNTQQNGGGYSSADIYVFMTSQGSSGIVAWTISTTDGTATIGTPPGPFTLQDLENAGGSIQVDPSTVAAGGRIYFATSSDIASSVSGPSPGLTDYYYDYIEFALNSGTANNLNVDTTQVDQFGFPITLNVSPADPNFPDGSGIVPTLDRQTLIDYFQSMATGALVLFGDCVSGSGTPPYCVLNPNHVCYNQLHATMLEGTVTALGSAGQWQAYFTITGPGSPPPDNSGLSTGMRVSGPTIPAGMVLGPGALSQSGNMVVLASSALVNPFTSSSTPIQLYFYNAISSGLATYFDQAIDGFFDYYKNNPGLLKIEENNGGTDYVYTGNVVQVENVTAIDNSMQTYTVLQFTGGQNETYNIYYPFFTTNSPAGKTTPFGQPVPPPPIWFSTLVGGASSGLTMYEPPSLMVFAADGAFADSTQQQSWNPALNAAIQGAMENAVVTALARGSATNWIFKEGTIFPASNPNVATVELAAGQNLQGISDDQYMSSIQLADAPMSVLWMPPALPPPSAPANWFLVNSPVPMQSTTQDLLTFSEFYPAGGTWSGYAYFFHNGTGQSITVGGRAYALPYDDQGGFSTDLSSTWQSGGTPSTATITLGPWQPASSRFRRS